MRILIDIGHPAHAHFFRNPIRLLVEHGHEVIVTSRDKEMALDLLDHFGIEHVSLSALGKGGIFSLGYELIVRDYRLYRIVSKQRPDVMAAIGGVFISHVGRLTGIPSLVFYDTENASLQNAITYPFASTVITPTCYKAWLPRGRSVRYRGYHELSYLHPKYFHPDREKALGNGLAATGDTFLLRLVSWKASHDLREGHWTVDLVERLVAKLEALGKVLISSEGPLPGALERRRYAGDPAEIHHVMAFCRAYVGESATMASECAVLGIPAVYAAETGRGYTDEQDERYGLVKNIRRLEWDRIEQAVDSILGEHESRWAEARSALLSDTIDVAEFVTEFIEGYGDPSSRSTQAGAN